MSKEYYWWDLDESTFKGVLYDSINMYFLHDHPYKNWEEFSEADPHMAYAHLTIPIKSSVKDINRHDWLKSIVDLTLFRFASLRDIAFHFVNEVLELKIPDNRLNIKQLKKDLRDNHKEILSSLKVLDSTGAPLRLDRNERAHKGFCDLYTGDDQLFKSISWLEGHKADINGDGYNLVEIYECSRDKIYSIVVKEVNDALSACIDLVDELYFHYRDRHDELSKNSRNGVSGHFNSYHRNK